MKGSRIVQLSLALILFILSQFGCANPENSNTATINANTAVAQATPDQAAITAEITRIENDWPRIIKERDVTAVKRIEADDVVLVYPDGSIGGKDQDAKDIESGALSYDSWDISELKVNVIDTDAAVASMHITVKNGRYKTPDGKSNNISGQYRSIDTFARRNGQWQLVASATTPLMPAAGASATPKGSPEAAASPAMKPSPMMKPSPAAKTSPPKKPAAPVKTP